MSITLMEAFDFIEDDLAHNRRGEYSPRQKAKLSKTTKASRRNLLIVALVLLAFATYLALPFLQAMSLQGDILRLIGVIGLLGLSALFFSGLFDRTEFEITHVEGRVQFISKNSTTDHDGHLVTDTSYYIVVGENHFTVDTSQYDAFTQGHIYRVYSGQTNLLSTGILTIEYIGPPN